MNPDRSVFGMADDMIDRCGVDRKPIERPQFNESRCHPPMRSDVWGADQWEEMQRIWRGEQD